MLPGADAITAVAKDEDGNEVTEIMEGGDPVYLTITVDRGHRQVRITDEELTVDIRAADAAQLGPTTTCRSRGLRWRGARRVSRPTTSTWRSKLSARNDEDVGMNISC